MMRRIFFISCIILFFIISANAEEKFNSPNSSNQYSRSNPPYCGEKGVAWDVATIPQIGCFALSPGKSATGTFLGTIIKVSVDTNGKEVITADGKPIPDDSRQSPLKVNNMYVRVGGVAGVMFCEDSNGTEGDCVTRIDVMSNNPDKSVNFDVIKCLKMMCAGDQENWDYEKSGDAQKDRDASNAFWHEGKTPEESACKQKLFVYMMALGGGGADQETENYREQVMAQWKKELPKDATICDTVKILERIMFPQGSPLEANKNTAQNVKEKELDIIKYLKQKNEINEEIKNLCRKEEYKIIFVKTACMPEGITSEQLSDKSVITDTEKVTYLKYHEEALALRKKMFDLLQVSKSPKDKEYLLSLKREYGKADKMVNDLLERKISWGNFNKFKKDNYEEIKRERIRISNRHTVFDEKCSIAGEHIYRHPDNIKGVFLDPNLGVEFTFKNGVLNGFEKGKIMGLTLLRDGSLFYLEEKNYFTDTKAAFLRTSFREGSYTRTETNHLESNYAVITNEFNIPESLNIEGAEIIIKDLKDNSIIATTTYVHDLNNDKFCGHVVNGKFSTEEFLANSLNITKNK